MKVIYLINNHSFANYDYWLDVPLSTILEMLDTIKWFSEQEKEAIEKAKRTPPPPMPPMPRR